MFKDETKEVVVLVDEDDKEIGIMPKAAVHHGQTPLHRGFSIYIFEPVHGNILVQQRNKKKVTWGGFWSNSCCGHPTQGESYQEAAKRRVVQELGIKVRAVEKIADYRYRFERNGIVENEVCPILVGLAKNEVLQPNPAEIEDVRWQRWSEYLKDMEQRRELHSPWSKEQVIILSQSPRFKDWISEHAIVLQ